MKMWEGHSAITGSSLVKVELNRADPIGKVPKTGSPGLTSPSRG